MPASKAEQVFDALRTLLATVSGASVERNSVLPEKTPAGGLIILRDGDPGEPEHTGRIDVRFADTTLIDLAAGGFRSTLSLLTPSRRRRSSC